MPITRHIKASELSPSLQNKFNVDPHQFLKVTVEIEEVDYDVDGTPMPPESQISDSLIKAVEESEAEYKKGNFVRCETEEETDAFFDKIWNEDD